jgi:integrase/recombinase XerD
LYRSALAVPPPTPCEAPPKSPRLSRGSDIAAVTFSKRSPRDFSLPKVPQAIIHTFTDDQLHALLAAPDQRRWVGARDRAILVLLLDTLGRISEISGLNLGDVDLEGRSIRVMGKGRKQRDLPFGQIAAQAMRRYARSVGDHRPNDPFFISRNGLRLGREGVAAAMRTYARRAKIVGVRCSPHTLRHTGAKRFILSGGDVFTLQKLLGHTSLAMVRRYVELASGDIRNQHDRFSPADTLLRRPHPR